MYLIQAIEWQQSDCQFRNSGSTWFACIKRVHITVHHITTWSLRLLIMFMSSQVRILKPSGVDPHRLCRPLSHWLMFEQCRYGTAGLIRNSKSRLTKHFKSFQATQYSPCLKCSISNPVDTRSTRSVMKAR